MARTLREEPTRARAAHGDERKKGPNSPESADDIHFQTPGVESIMAAVGRWRRGNRRERRDVRFEEVVLEVRIVIVGSPQARAARREF